MDVRTFLFAIVLLVLVDAVWLYFIGRAALAMTETIQGSPVSLRILPVLVVYVALAYLVQLPTTPTQAALLGASVYAVYEFTNLALFKHYSPLIAVADTMWGGILFATVHMILQRAL